MDTESGLTFVRHRMYDPRLGRFTQTDPILGNRPSQHYAYAGNNPVGKSDPRGLAPRNTDAYWVDDSPGGPSNYGRTSFTYEGPTLEGIGAFVDQLSTHFDPSVQGWKLGNAVWSRMGVDIPIHPRVVLGEALFPNQEQARENAETTATVADLALASYGATELIYQAPKMFNAIKSLPSVAQMLAGEGRFFASGGAVALESAGAEGLSWAAAGASPGASKLVYAASSLGGSRLSPEERAMRPTVLERTPRHHVFPKEAKYQQWFKNHNFNVNDFTIELDWGTHSAIHDVGWSEDIMGALESAEKLKGSPLSQSEILDVGKEMLQKYNIKDYKFIPYER